MLIDCGLCACSNTSCETEITLHKLIQSSVTDNILEVIVGPIYSITVSTILSKYNVIMYPLTQRTFSEHVHCALTVTIALQLIRA